MASKRSADKSTLWARACASCGGCGCLFLALSILSGIYHNLSETPTVKSLTIASSDARPASPTPKTSEEIKAAAAKEKVEKTKQAAQEKAEKLQRKKDEADLEATTSQAS